MTKYWQIGSGSGDRDYSEECIELGMAFVGEGNYGTMQQIAEGNIIVLRHGQSKVVAVGRAVRHPEEDRVTGCGDKDLSRDFVGWDLPAYCYVEWYRPRPPLEKITGMSRSALSRIHKDGPKKYADYVLASKSIPDGKPGKDLANREILELEEVRDYLVSKGLKSEVAETFVPKLKRIQDLAEHYYGFGYRSWDDVKEHEARTFLIVPLLLSLGWEERRIKIELSPDKLNVEKQGNKSIDIACFSQDFRPGEDQINRENCKVLIESKRFSSGVTTQAVEQVKNYAEMSGCKLVLVSNGYCYKAFVRDENEEFPDKPAAYLNLRALARDYPFDPDVGGALELLRLLMPESWM